MSSAKGLLNYVGMRTYLRMRITMTGVARACTKLIHFVINTVFSLPYYMMTVSIFGVSARALGSLHFGEELYYELHMLLHDSMRLRLASSQLLTEEASVGWWLNTPACQSRVTTSGICAYYYNYVDT